MLILSLIATLLMSTLGAALVLAASADAAIAGNFRLAREALYAADAAAARALDELAATADWNAVLAGTIRSSFADGASTGTRTLADGAVLDLDGRINMLNCRKLSACTRPDLTANLDGRPWGVNNPVWTLFAHVPLESLVPSTATNSVFYAIVAVADDPAENDGDPLRDGDPATNAGAGVLMLRAEAFGPRGAHQVVGLTVRRADPARDFTAVHVLSWRHLRRGQP